LRDSSISVPTTLDSKSVGGRSSTNSSCVVRGIRVDTGLCEACVLYHMDKSSDCILVVSRICPLSSNESLALVTRLIYDQYLHLCQSLLDNLLLLLPWIMGRDIFLGGFQALSAHAWSYLDPASEDSEPISPTNLCAKPPHMHRSSCRKHASQMVCYMLSPASSVRLRTLRKQ